MIFSKYQALGNDYLVGTPDKNELLPAEDVRRLCHRHFGIGADGILMGPTRLGDKHFGVSIYNADGSLAEISGNGLTIFSKYLLDHHYIRLNEKFYLKPSEKCESEAVCCEENGEVMVKILLGKGYFLESFSWEVPEFFQKSFHLEQSLTLFKINMGNPHCVVPVPLPTKELACGLGTLLENHPQFPEKTNVQFVHWSPENHQATIQIWERGSGYTLGSGSSSCAVACAFAHIFKEKTGALVISMPGGKLKVNWENQSFFFSNCAYKIADVKPCL